MNNTSTPEQSEFFAELARRLGLDHVPQDLRELACWLSGTWPALEEEPDQRREQLSGEDSQPLA
jgi:hypothetical protein